MNIHDSTEWASIKHALDPDPESPRNKLVATHDYVVATRGVVMSVRPRVSPLAGEVDADTGRSATVVYDAATGEVVTDTRLNKLGMIAADFLEGRGGYGLGRPTITLDLRRIMLFRAMKALRDEHALHKAQRPELPAFNDCWIEIDVRSDDTTIELWLKTTADRGRWLARAALTVDPEHVGARVAISLRPKDINDAVRALAQHDDVRLHLYDESLPAELSAGPFTRELMCPARTTPTRRHR